MYISYVSLSLILLPAIIILWFVYVIYKLLNKKYNFNKDNGGAAIKLKFDYSIVLIVFVLLSFCSAVYCFNYDKLFSVISIIMLSLFSVGIVSNMFSNSHLMKKLLKRIKNKKRFNSIIMIVSTIDIVVLEAISIILWNNQTNQGTVL